MKTLKLQALESVTKPMPKSNSFNMRLIRRGDGSGTVNIMLSWNPQRLQTVTIDGGVFIINGEEKSVLVDAHPSLINDIPVKVTAKEAYISTLQDASSGFRMKEFASSNPDNSPWIDYNFYMGRLDFFTRMFDSIVGFNRPVYGLKMVPYYDPQATTLIFNGAGKFNQPLAHLDMSISKSIDGFFVSAYEFNQPLPWDTSNIEIMGFCFANCYAFNQPLPWDVRKVVNMSRMFLNAWSFDQDFSKWQFNKEVTLDDFITFSGMSPANYDKLLKNLRNTDFSGRTNPKVFGAFGVRYTAAGAADREALVADGWTITDSGQTII